MNIPSALCEYEIVENEWACEDYRQFRFPKSKKRRIQKKWKQSYRNWKTYYDRVFFNPKERKVCVHPKMAYKLREQIAERAMP
jgi:hypothetical protein